MYFFIIDSAIKYGEESPLPRRREPNFVLQVPNRIGSPLSCVTSRGRGTLGSALFTIFNCRIYINSAIKYSEKGNQEYTCTTVFHHHKLRPFYKFVILNCRIKNNWRARRALLSLTTDVYCSSSFNNHVSPP